VPFSKRRNKLEVPRRNLIFLLPITGILLFSCSINPRSPDLNVDANWELPSQPLSIINIPITIDLRPYLAATDSAVPSIFKGKEATCEGVSYSYTFVRDPISFKGIDKHLNFAINGRYALNLNYCPQCTEIFNETGNCVIPRIYTSCGVDEPMRELLIEYTTEIDIKKNYQLQSNTKLKELRALSPCKITVFNYNATDKILKEVKSSLIDLEQDIDKDISSINLRPDIEKVWNSLSEVNQLEGYGFLHMNPADISISRVRYSNDTAFVKAQLTAKPKIYLDSANCIKKELPQLLDYKEVDGFNVATDISASYDSLGAVLTNQLQNTELDFKGRKIILDGISINGALNHKLSLKVAFSGKKKGILYLDGTPVFDSTTQRISFPDLEFDIKTKSAILRSAKWLFNDKLTKKIRNLSDIDLSTYLDTLKNTLNNNLQGEITEGVDLNGSINDVYITVVQPLESHLFIRVLSKGKLSIAM